LIAILSSRRGLRTSQRYFHADFRIFVDKTVEHGECDRAVDVALGHGLLPVPERLRWIEAANALEDFLLLGFVILNSQAQFHDGAKRSRDPGPDPPTHPACEFYHDREIIEDRLRNRLFVGRNAHFHQLHLAAESFATRTQGVDICCRFRKPLRSWPFAQGLQGGRVHIGSLARPARSKAVARGSVG